MTACSTHGGSFYRNGLGRHLINFTESRDAAPRIHMCIYVCVYMYVCMCVYIYIYIYTHMCMCVHLSLSLYIYIYMYIICKCNNNDTNIVLLSPSGMSGTHSTQTG